MVAYPGYALQRKEVSNKLKSADLINTTYIFLQNKLSTYTMRLTAIYMFIMLKVSERLLHIAVTA